MSDDTQQDDAVVQTSDQSGDAPVVDSAAQDSSVAAVAAATAQPTTIDEDKSWQRRYDRLTNEISTDLIGYAKTYGGGRNIVGFLKQFESLLGNPTLGPLAQQFLKTGSVELPKPKNEWDEPAQEPEWKAALNPLLAELQNVRQELTAMKTQTGMAKVTQHTAQFLKDYPLSESERAQFAAAMEEKLASFATNANGASILQGMDYRTFKAIALPEIEEHIEQIVARKASRNKAAVVQKATDAPGLAAAGKETKPNGPLPKSVEELRRSVQKAFSEGLLQ
jgi:hypothetical protein